MNVRLLTICSVFASCLAFADAEKGIVPPMRGENDPFPAKATAYDLDKIHMEQLGRGVVAVRSNEKDVWVAWRYRTIDPKEIAFNVYRDGKLVTPSPITNVTFFVDSNAWHGATMEYEVRPVLGNGEWGMETFHELKSGRGKWKLPAAAAIGYIDIPLVEPPQNDMPDGSKMGHHANDCSVGDVDGDGEYELFVKWEANAAADNLGGWPGETSFECLKLPSGRSLWRIDMGYNMRAGQHYMPFMVYDFDCDGKAELIVRSAPGTRDGTGRTLKEDGTWSKPGEKVAVKDYRENGAVLYAPEFLTVFNGLTGRAMDTVKYDPPFENPWIWGDHAKSIGNRSHRFLAAVAYLDGVRPSAVFCRGYYNRTCLAAWDWDGKSLRERWFFDSESPRWRGKGYSGQGFHNLRVADVDFDGRDEIVYGSMVVDDNGDGLYTTKMGHGDQVHIVQSTPNHIGLQVWTCHEHSGDGVVLRDAKTGKMIFREPRRADVGNCLAADVDPYSPGVEFFAAASIGAFDHTGRWLGVARNKGMYYQTLRFAIWWLGDMSRSLLPGSDGVYDYSVRYRGTGLRQKFEDCEANNGSKGNPCLVADILGDWREEALYRRKDGKAIRMYVSTFPTEWRFHSFMEDPVYRISVATENCGYNVAPEPSFYFGRDLLGHGIWFRGCYLP